MRRTAAVLSSLLAVSLGVACSASAQDSTRGKAALTLAGKAIVVDYGRPSLKGRDMLGKAAVGDEWRMGANSPTTLETPVGLAFGATQVAPGTYVLRAKKVSATAWTLKLVRDGKDAAEVPLETSPLDKSVETFTIDLTEQQGQGVFRMTWGTLALSTRFSAK